MLLKKNVIYPFFSKFHRNYTLLEILDYALFNGQLAHCGHRSTNDRLPQFKRGDEFE